MIASASELGVCAAHPKRARLFGSWLGCRDQHLLLDPKPVWRCLDHPVGGRGTPAKRLTAALPHMLINQNILVS